MTGLTPRGMIDSHCHLEQKEAFFRRDQLISDCRDAGMKALVTVCARPSDLALTLELAERHRGFVFATAGIHPLEAVSHSEKEVDSYIESIKARRSELKAVGEIGLDDVLVRDPAKKRRSRDVFIQFIGLAKELGLPISIHCREAYPEAMKTLSDHGAKDVVFHYFNQPAFIRDIADHGWALSLPAILHSSRSKLATILKGAEEGAADVMLETDSPVSLSGGKRMTPMDLGLLVDAVAKERDEPPEQAAAETARAAAEFFSLF